MIIYENLSDNYANIDISKIGIEKANQIGVEIKIIEISESLYIKIRKYLLENDFYFKYWMSGNHPNHDVRITNRKFILEKATSKNKTIFSINGKFTNGINHFIPLKEQIAVYERLKKDQNKLTILDLFYGILRKYPNDIYKVSFLINNKPNEKLTQHCLEYIEYIKAFEDPEQLKNLEETERRFFPSRYKYEKKNYSKERGAYIDLYNSLSNTNETRSDIYLSDGVSITANGDLKDI